MTQQPPSTPPDGKGLPASGIASLQGACPLCGETILTIAGGTVTFSASHATVQDNSGTIVIKLHHGPTPIAMHPGTIDLPQPGIVIENMVIRSFS